MTIALFSYGTLQLPRVQLANYGRVLSGRPDVLTGYRLVQLAISDREVVRISGKAVHTLAQATNDPEDSIAGTLFELSEEELAATDAYEVDVYTRVEAILQSGRSAWVYVGPAATD